MSDTVSRKALIDWLKDREQEALDEFVRTDRRFCSGEHSAFEDVREKIESGAFTFTESQGEIESLKAITELAVKGLNESKIALKHTASLAHLPYCTCPPCNAIGFVEYTLSEIERLSHA